MYLHLAQAADQPAGGLAGWAVDLIDSLGGPGLALLTALDAMVSIIPADMLMPFVGNWTRQGSLSLGAAIAWSTTGSVVGALVLYTLAARLGRDRARTLLVKIPGCKPADVDRVEVWFARHGYKAVLFGRLLPGVRSFISLPAGVERMPVLTFALLSGLGSLTWNSTLLIGGYQLGENWQRMTEVSGILLYFIIGAVGIAAAIYLARRRARRRPAARESEAD